MTADTTEMVENAVDVHFPSASLVRTMPGGSENLTVQVRLDAEDMVLRVYLRPDYRRFEGEINTLLELVKMGAPTPRPRHWGTTCPVFGTPFLTYPMLPGEPLTTAAEHLSARRVADVVGRLVVVVTEIASRLPVTSYGYLHLPASSISTTAHHHVDSYATVIARHQLIADELLARAVKAVGTHAVMLATSRPRLVHPDLKPDNILVDGEQIAVIDWEMPVGGHPALSYGGLLSDGLPHPVLRDGLLLHLDSLDPADRIAALTAGLLRCLETLSYIPANPPFLNGRKLRPDADDLALSITTLLNWMPR